MVPEVEGCASSPLLTFDDVEGRLVEAVRISWRMPDRERGWMRFRVVWPEMRRHIRYGDYDARGGDMAAAPAPLRTAALTRAEVESMNEAFGWLDGIDPADRKLIGLVLRQLASGAARISWLDLLRPMGKMHGSEGLRKRYSRAMTRVAHAANMRA